MTYLEVSYRYTGPLAPVQLKRLGELPGQYGILALQMDEEKQVARIRYDASRLTESEVVHWVRRAGIPLTERVEVNSISS